MKMLIALDLDRLIGRADGSLPWRLPGDLKRFKELTWGGTLIVGRKTAETLPTLKNRTILVATRSEHPTVVNDDGKGSLEYLCHQYPSAWICGGGQVYRAALELGVVTEIYATRVMRRVRSNINDVLAPVWEDDDYWKPFTLASVELGADRNTQYEVWRRA